MAPRFLRFKEVGLMCGLSRTTIWRMQRDGKFPERRRIGPNAVRWLAGDVEEWIRTRERGR
jgi:predicted DNA-binding transcriptional regulator AlpA